MNKYNKKKISSKKLILFMPSMEGGGVEKNIILIANYFTKYIENLNLITFDNKFNKKFDKKVNIINFTNNKNRRIKYIKYFFCIFLLIKEIIKNKNVLVFAFQANIYAIIICKLFGVKIITRSNSSPSGWTKNFFKIFIFKLFFKFTDLVIVNSKEFKIQIDQMFNIKSKLIYNPLNKKEIIRMSNKKITDSFFNTKKFLFLINIARFTDQKDQITLLKSFNLIKNKIKSKLLIIGYGPNKEKLKRFISKNNLTKLVKIINFTNNPFPYLKKSDLFILTSKFEGLPNVLLESMVLKKFVISTDCPTGPREILNNGKYGYLFKIGDYKELAKLILMYKKNIKKNKKRIQEGFKSLENFDYKKNCYNYYKAVKKLI